MKTQLLSLLCLVIFPLMARTEGIIITSFEKAAGEQGSSGNTSVMKIDGKEVVPGKTVIQPNTPVTIPDGYIARFTDAGNNNFTTTGTQIILSFTPGKKSAVEWEAALAPENRDILIVNAGIFITPAKTGLCKGRLELEPNTKEGEYYYNLKFTSLAGSMVLAFDYDVIAGGEDRIGFKKVLVLNEKKSIDYQWRNIKNHTFKNWDACIAYYENEYKENTSAAAEPRLLPASYHNLIRAYTGSKNMVQKNKELCEAGILLASSGKYKTWLSLFYKDLGSWYMEQNKNEEAINYLNKALFLYEYTGASSVFAASVLCNIGFAYSGKGQFTDSKDSFKKALAVCRLCGLKGRLPGSILANMGINYREQEKFSEAQDYLEQAVTEFKNQGISGYYPGGVWANISFIYSLYEDNKDWKKVLTYSDKALDEYIAGNIAGKPLEGLFTNIFRQMEKHAEAGSHVKAFSEKALNGYKQQNNPLGTGQSNGALALYYYYTGNLGKFKQYTDDGLAAYKAGGITGEFLGDLYFLYVMRAQLEGDTKAEEEYLKLGIEERLKDKDPNPLYLAQGFQSLAEFYVRRGDEGDKEKAKDNYLEAIKNYKAAGVDDLVHICQRAMEEL